MLTPTGVTSSAYWSAIKAGNRTHVRLTFTGQGIVLEDEDIYIGTGLNIEDILNGETDLVFGSALAKQITTTILNSSKLDGLIWTGEFTLEMGVEIGLSTNWVTIGIFSGEKPNNVTSSRTIDFTAYDRMKYFDILADKYLASITYPITIQGIYDGLCAFVGVDNVPGDELANIMTRSYSEFPVDLSGYTCRDILAYIAEACGCYAKITPDGKVKMVWFTDNTGHAVTGDYEFSVESADINNGMIWDVADTYIWNDFDTMTWNEVCGYEEEYSIDQMLIKQFDSMDINYPSALGGNIYTIVNNPFLICETYAHITNYIAPLYNRLIAFGGYVPVNINCIGCWLVEAGDVITVDVNENTITVPVFVKHMNWKGSITDVYETTGNKVRSVYSSETQKEQIATSKYIKLYVGDKYYRTVSGIEIESGGVTISGANYLKVKSGGTFDVESTNFKISSTEHKMECGYWSFYDDGLSFWDSVYAFGRTFYIRNLQRGYPMYSVGLLFDDRYQDSDNHDGGYLEMYYADGAGGDKISVAFTATYYSSAYHAYFMPNVDNVVYLGKSNKRFSLAYINTIMTSSINCSDGGIIASLFTGTVRGGFMPDTTSEKNLNKLDTSAVWWMNTSGLSNIPTGLSGDFELEVRESGPANNNRITQKIYVPSAIYMRHRVSGTWSSWYKFTGTAV